MKVVFALSVNAPWPEFVNRGGQIEKILLSYAALRELPPEKDLMGMLSQSQNEKDAPK